MKSFQAGIDASWCVATETYFSFAYACVRKTDMQFDSFTETNSLAHASVPKHLCFIVLARVKRQNGRQPFPVIALPNMCWVGGVVGWVGLCLVQSAQCGGKESTS